MILQNWVIVVSCDFIGGAHLVSQHLAEFGSHIDSGRGDIKILLCHMITESHEIKGQCDFMGRIPSW